MKTITITAQAAQQLREFAEEKGIPMKEGTPATGGGLVIEIDDQVDSYLQAIDADPSKAINIVATGQFGRA